MYKIYKDKTRDIQVIVRIADSASIPEDDRNSDYREYLAWLADGNRPEPWETE